LFSPFSSPDLSKSRVLGTSPLSDVSAMGKWLYLPSFFPKPPFFFPAAHPVGQLPPVPLGTSSSSCFGGPAPQTLFKMLQKLPRFRRTPVFPRVLPPPPVSDLLNWCVESPPVMPHFFSFTRPGLALDFQGFLAPTGVLFVILAWEPPPPPVSPPLCAFFGGRSWAD